MSKNNAGARQRLREAIAVAADAKRAFKQAEKVHERAAKEVQRAQERLDSFADLDERIKRHRVAALKKGLDTTLPRELRESQLEKIAAREDMESARSACQQLETELEAARDALDFALLATGAAEGEVVFEEASKLSAELKIISARREHLRLVLSGVSSPGIHYSKIQEFIADALIEHEREMPIGQGPVLKARQFWEGFGKQVAADPDAPFPEPPSSKQLWG